MSLAQLAVLDTGSDRTLAERLIDQLSQAASQCGAARRIEQNQPYDPFILGSRCQGIVRSGAQPEQNKPRDAARCGEPIHGPADIDYRAFLGIQLARQRTAIADPGKVEPQAGKTILREQPSQDHVKAMRADAV